MSEKTNIESETDCMEDRLRSELLNQTLQNERLRVKIAHLENALEALNPAPQTIRCDKCGATCNHPQTIGERCRAYTVQGPAREQRRCRGIYRLERGPAER